MSGTINGTDAATPQSTDVRTDAPVKLSMQLGEHFAFNFEGPEDVAREIAAEFMNFVCQHGGYEHESGIEAGEVSH